MYYIHPPPPPSPTPSAGAKNSNPTALAEELVEIKHEWFTRLQAQVLPSLLHSFSVVYNV